MRNLQATQLIFELSKSGRCGVAFPNCDVPENRVEELIPSSFLADEPPELPEVNEPDVVRHFTNLSTLNMSVDTHFYPLGSCTMKYNPKRNERIASMGRAAPQRVECTVAKVLVFGTSGLDQYLEGCGVLLGEPGERGEDTLLAQ